VSGKGRSPEAGVSKVRTSSHKFFNGCLCRINLIAIFNSKKNAAPQKDCRGYGTQSRGSPGYWFAWKREHVWAVTRRKRSLKQAALGGLAH
jgi:hypothetical protein